MIKNFWISDLVDQYGQYQGRLPKLGLNKTKKYHWYKK